MTSGLWLRNEGSFMRRISRLATAIVIAMSAAGCAATMSVGAHVAPGLDVTRYRTFAWGPPDALPTGDPRLDDDAAFNDRLQGAVERGLSTKGLALMASGAADLLVHYHASVTRRIDVEAADRLHGYCAPGGCTSDAMTYEAGTLVLDIVDARTNRVIWRGWVQNRVEHMLGGQDPGTIEQAVERMLKRFPARS
jgi:hypothetical protein